MEWNTGLSVGAVSKATSRLMVPVMLSLLLTAARAASHTDTQKFLRGYRHCWHPYALPAETNIAEVEKMCALGFDTVGIIFVGPYNGGSIDFSKLDEAIKFINKHGQRVVLHICPRFLESEGISDRLDNGKILPNIWNRNPNYSILDIFDKAQRAKAVDYVSICGKRYGKDKRVAAFVVGWGYQGETGFYNGDWNTKHEYMGAECAGYSDCALVGYNKWRVKKKLPRLSELPRPTGSRQSRDYVLFHRFRSEFVREVFHKEIIAALKAQTDVPVGIFAYISADTNSYARNWTDAPNADFFRSAGSCASYDLARTLVDSGIGYEDAWLNDGNWDFTAAAMERDEARQIAKGAVFHAMYVRVYDTEPQWEKGLFEKVVSFLKTQNLEKQIKRVEPTVALYQPTWGAAVFPWKSESQPFLPKVEYWHYILKMMGLVESFGLPYQLITESDLMEPSRLRRFRHIIVPMWDVMPEVIGRSNYERLNRDARVVKVPLKEWALTRTEFRELLNRAGISPKLDFDSDKALAGRVHNLIFNCGSEPVRVRVPERAEEIELGPNQYELLNQ